ncbi:MAG: peptide chain release factor-like protein [Chlamydiota bacterium]
MSISEEKWKALRARMEDLGIEESDLEEKFVIGSGKGGQKMQKTASCVHLLHVPSAIAVKCQKERLRESNRFFARRILCEKLEMRLFPQKNPQKMLRDKIRRNKKKRAKRFQKKQQEDSSSNNQEE